MSTRRGNSQFKVVKSLGILLIQGRRIQGGIQTKPSIHQQKEHLLFGEGGRQQTSYCVPVLSPHSALGVAVAESLHDQMCEASAASTMERASQLFYYTPTSGPLFIIQSSNCYRGRYIKMEHGTNVIGPLRHIAQDTMLEGIAIQVNICRAYTAFKRAKQALIRNTRGPKRTQVKL